MRKSIYHFAIMPTLLLGLGILSACQNDSITSKNTVELQRQVSQTIEFNKNWLFKKSQQQSDLEQVSADWQTVNIPHTPTLEPEIVNDQWQGNAWYQKQFDVPSDWLNKVVLIRFEAAMNEADIWLNGEKIGHHIGGYLPFTLDLSNFVKVGSNLITVRLNNQDNPLTGPKPLKLLDFNTYGGLYRGVKLLIKDKLAITDEILADEIAGGGVFVTFPKVERSQSIVSVQTHIENRYSFTKTFSLQQTLFWQGKEVKNQRQDYSLAAGESQHFRQSLNISNPQLWSPKTANLYTLKTALFSGDRLIEQQTRKIGIREFSFNNNHELMINGEVTFLRGVNRHQEYPHVGYAISPQADYRDAVKIKSAGFDYVRLSHYPHSSDFMRAADELGLVLLDAVLGWQFYNPDNAFEQYVVDSCKNLIRRDRNHPSVVAWECSLNESDMPDEFIAQLSDTVHQEYPGSFSAGWEKGYDIFVQARQHRLQHYETPNQPYIVSEYGDWEYYAQNAGLNQDSWNGLKDEERTSRQLLNSGETRLLQQAMNLQEAHDDNFTVPAFADGYWVMFDYNRGYADDIESSGIMSLYRQPKYSYYFYQSQRDPTEFSTQFSSGPMVFIASQWNPESNPNIRVFSNVDEVALYLNNELIAKKQVAKDKYSQHLAHPPYHFSVPKFSPGTLRAEALINGKMVASHTVTTPGKPAALTLKLDTSGIAPQVGNNDLLFVYAQLVDSRGNPVANNDVPVTITVNGDIQLLNTDNAGSTPTVLTSQGQAAFLIRIGNSLSGASVAVVSDNLTQATLNLNTLNLQNIYMAQ